MIYLKIYKILSANQGYIINQNLSSYMAFCANVNADSLDAAFGKGNDVNGIGRQLAMYSWFKGTDKTEFPFTYLKTIDKFRIFHLFLVLF